MLNNERGFSILESVIVVAITGVVLMTSARLTKSQVSVSNRINKLTNVEDKMQELRWKLSSSSNCSPNFDPANASPLSFNSANMGTAKINLQKIQSFPGLQDLIAKNGTFGPEITVKDIYIDNLVAVDPANFIGSLVIDLDLGENASDTKNIIREMPIVISTSTTGSTTNIVGCASTQGELTGGSLIKTEIFKTDGVFTVPADVTEIVVEAWGAGGGGGGSAGHAARNAACGGGGGGAGSYEKSKLTVTPGQTFAIDIGQGGAGSAGGDNVSSNSGAPVAGERTTFALQVIATGGHAAYGCLWYIHPTFGLVGVTGRGGQGTGYPTPLAYSGNLVSSYGGWGADGTYTYHTMQYAYGGTGGAAYGGGSAAQGQPGIFPGGGGGGANKYSQPGYNTLPGGDGANGLVIIQY